MHVHLCLFFIFICLVISYMYICVCYSCVVPAFSLKWNSLVIVCMCIFVYLFVFRVAPTFTLNGAVLYACTFVFVFDLHVWHPRFPLNGALF